MVRGRKWTDESRVRLVLTIAQDDWTRVAPQLQAVSRQLDAAFGPLPRSPEDREVQSVFGMLQEGLGLGFRRGKGKGFGAARVERRFLARDGNRVVYRSDAPLDALHGRVFEALQRLHHRLRYCPRPACRRLFLAAHGLQMYCSDRCSQTHRNERFKEAHRDELYERRRKAYERKLEREGAKWKPERRGPRQRLRGQIPTCP